MNFTSQYAGHTISMGNGRYIQFKDSMYSTEDETEIEFLLKHREFGSVIKSSDTVPKINKEELPLISVIIPSRINENIDVMPSLCKQTYKNLEIIIIYDFRGEGASKTRNRGVEKASGEYILFCDNDLELAPDAIKSLYMTLVKSNSGWAFGKFRMDGIEYNKGKDLNIPNNKSSRAYIDWFECIPILSLIKAEAKPRFDEQMKKFVDWDLWVSLDKAGHSPVFCDKVLFTTKNRPGGISNCSHEVSVYWRNYLYAKHNVMKNNKKIADIVIPHHDRHDFLKKTLDRLDNSIFNIIVVSGGTFAENSNKGARLAETDNIIILNDDTEVDNDLLIRMCERQEDVVGCAQFIPSFNKTILGMGCGQKDGKPRWFLAESKENVLIPNGFLYRFKKKAWKKLGGFNEMFRNGGEDQDLGMRAVEMGMSITNLDDVVVHHHSQSKGRHDFVDENNQLMQKLWPIERIQKIL